MKPIAGGVQKFLFCKKRPCAKKEFLHSSTWKPLPESTRIAFKKGFQAHPEDSVPPGRLKIARQFIAGINEKKINPSPENLSPAMNCRAIFRNPIKRTVLILFCKAE
jgi:hypothetical protein